MLCCQAPCSLRLHSVLATGFHNCLSGALQDLDLGLGAPSAYSQQLSLPRARDMAIIRGAVTPLSAGLIAQLALAPGDAQRLREHPLLAQLVPSARWVGGGHGNSAK